MKLKKAAATLSSADYVGKNEETHRNGIWDTGGEGDYKPGILKTSSGTTTKTKSETTVTTSRTSKTKSETNDVRNVCIGENSTRYL
jgi:hypothetical protein